MKSAPKDRLARAAEGYAFMTGLCAALGCMVQSENYLMNLVYEVVCAGKCEAAA